MADEVTWAAAVAAIASAIASGAAFFNVYFARKAADFSNCLEVVKQLGDALRKMSAAKAKGDSAAHLFEFRELLNLFEALAHLINDGKVASSTLRFTGRFLEETLAQVNAMSGMKDRITKEMTIPESFLELRKFETKNQKRIDRLTDQFEKQRRLLEAENKTAPGEGR